MNQQNNVAVQASTNLFSTRTMIKIAIFSAIAFVVMYVEFPLAALFPAYLQIDLSDVIVLIGGITLGPVATIFIELIKNLLHLLLRGNTGGVGELANFMVGIALILPPVVVYRKFKTLISLIGGIVLGVLAMVIVGGLGNYFIFLPFYGVGTEDLLPSILAVYMPFNAVKGAIVGLVGVILHQSIKGFYKYFNA